LTAVELEVRRATIKDVEWIVDLSACVQAALTASGSSQRIGPLERATIESTVRAGNGFILQIGERPIGSTLVDPAAAYPALPLVEWGLAALPAPRWYLHALMLEPAERGNGFGKRFLDGMRDLVVPGGLGTIILDCWAGNHTLRDFYHRAGFRLHGVFDTGLGFGVAVFVTPTATAE
jgi:GNAT superfamily N-acetyltransferase